MATVYGYARVSSRDQNLNRQLDALGAYGVEPANIFADHASGKDFDRPRYRELLCALDSGDVLVVLSIDRLGRNYSEILEEWRRITKELGAAIVVLDMPLLDTRARDCGGSDVTSTLIADIVFHSTFPQRELEKEKEVIVDEINSYKDSPSDRIFDDFEDMIFVGSSLGHNILGCKSALMKYTRDDLLRFVARTYNTDQMVFSVIGNVSAKRFKDTCDRYFGGMGESLRGFTRDAVVPVASFSKELHRKCYQAHCILGGRAYNLNDERRVVLSLLTNLLGGPSANSLLNLAVRERNGLAYNIEAGFTPFSDTGLATIYFGTDKERADECLELIDLELTKIRSGKLSDRLLHIAKKQYLGQITIAMENNESYMLSAARSFLVYNNIDAMETIREKIGTVTRDEIVAVANEIYGTQNLSMLMYR